MWHFVAIADPQAPDVRASARAITPGGAGAVSTRVHEDDAPSTADADLRISLNRFRQLRQDGAVMVIDVRSEHEYRAGHLPGATWIPLERIRGVAARLLALGRPIVAYCS